MNGMNDQRFHDLAMKVIARQSSEAERAELDSLMAGHPDLKAEFERLRGDVRVAKELLPMAAATEASAGEFPAYARERLQTKVRQSLRNSRKKDTQDEESRVWLWRLWLGLATAAVVILTLTIPLLLRPTAPVIQVAMLDLAGQTRGGDTNDLALLEAEWKDTPVQTFSTTSELDSWEQAWLATGRQSLVKIIFDRPAGEVRVVGQWKGRTFRETIAVQDGLDAALKRAKEFVEEQTGHALP